MPGGAHAAMEPSRTDATSWYRREVHPRLTAATAYPGIEWTSRQGKYLRGPCPFHKDRRGSRRFSVDTETLGFKCFSCGRTGDPVTFAAGGERPTGARYHEAVEKLAKAAGVRPLPTAGRPPKAPGSSQPSPQRKAQLREIWKAASPAAGTPAAIYLARRRAWPDGMGSHPLPEDLRWVPIGALTRALPKWKPPAGAAGAAAYGYRQAAPGSPVSAAKLEALTADGNRGEPRWRRNLGVFEHRRFTACQLPEGPLHVCEGEVTALALAARCIARGRGMVIATSGTSGFTAETCADTGTREVIIHPDRDAAAREAAWKLAQALRRAGRACTARGLSATEHDGRDEADALEALVKAAAGRLIESGETPAAAERAAWIEVLARRP